MTGTNERPLDPAKPYYTWHEDAETGRLIIFSECCADSFSLEEEAVLRERLNAREAAR